MSEERNSFASRSARPSAWRGWCSVAERGLPGEVELELPQDFFQGRRRARGDMRAVGPQQPFGLTGALVERHRAGGGEIAVLPGADQDHLAGSDLADVVQGIEGVDQGLRQQGFEVAAPGPAAAL